jgi:hypothetical protein
MEKNVDITKYPEALEEIIKYLDFLPDDDQVRKDFIMGFVLTGIIEVG